MEVRKSRRIAAMSRRRTSFNEQEAAQIVQAQKGTYPSHIVKRLLALKLKAVDGMDNRAISKIVGLHETSVSRLIGRYKSEGMEAIVGIRHNHGNRYMTMAQEEAFLAKFKEQAVGGHVIEVTQIHKAYEEAVGHSVTRAAIYYLLHKHKWRKIMPRSRHPKKASDEAIEAYKKNSGRDPKHPKGAASVTGNVSGRGWIWPD